jgi:fructokinase
MDLYGGIEAGGTKFVCAVGNNPDDLQNIIRIETTTPKETISKTIEYFKEQNKKNNLYAIGISSFGPVDLNQNSKTFGFITSTPKVGWQNTDFYGLIHKAFKIPVGFDTDVNGAALGEYEWGAAKGLDNFIYLTIGTGIGGGGMMNGELMHGLMHPEMGHILIPHNKKEDPFGGKCPFHKDCFEGLASGPAIEERWGSRGEELSIDHKGWYLEANYIAHATVNYICTLAPQKIILGGGVMQHKNILNLIHKKVKEILNNYIQVPELIENINKYIVLPGLGNRSGILGAIALAKKKHLNNLVH